SRPLPGFALMLGKGGAPKLKRADRSESGDCKVTPQYTDAELGARRNALVQAGESGLVLQTYLFACEHQTLEEFAQRLPSALSGPSLNKVAVKDQTGLRGKWDFSFKYTSKPPVASEADGVITVFDAIDKQLGLKLEAARIPTPVIVVDSVN